MDFVDIDSSGIEDLLRLPGHARHRRQHLLRLSIRRRPQHHRLVIIMSKADRNFTEFSRVHGGE